MKNKNYVLGSLVTYSCSVRGLTELSGLTSCFKVRPIFVGEKQLGITN